MAQRICIAIAITTLCTMNTHSFPMTNGSLNNPTLSKPEANHFRFTRESNEVRRLHRKYTHLHSLQPASSTSGPNMFLKVFNTDMLRFGEAVILAKMEADCFSKFGSQMKSSVVGSTMRPMDSKIVIPYGCYTKETQVQCIQCRNVSERPVWTLTQCEGLCNSVNVDRSINDICNQTCFSLYSSLRSYYIYNFFHFAQDEMVKEESASGSNNIASKNSNHAVTHGTTTSTVVVGNDGISIFKPRTFSTGKTKVSAQLGKIDVFCEGVYKRETSQKETTDYPPHFVFLRWNVVSSTDLARENGDVYRPTPLVYVIEQKEGNVSLSKVEWKTIGKTPFGMQPVKVSYRSSSYQWRITAVGPEGIDDIAETKNYITLDGYKSPGSPNRIYVMNMQIQNSSVSVLIGWEPPRENPCFYKIILKGTSSRTSTVRIQEPLGVHQYWFKELSFERMYHVRMTSQNSELDYESKFTDMNFKTPTCLQSFNYSFDKCAPPKVNEKYITADIKIMKTEKGHEQRLQVEFTWPPPLYSSENNTLEKYVVELTNYTGGDLTQDIIPMGYGFGSTNQYVVRGNVTRLLLKNLKSELDYTVMITAYSAGGGSQRAQHRFNTKLTNNINYGIWIYVAIVLVGVLGVFSMLFKGIKTYLNRNSKTKPMTRKKYIQSLKKREKQDTSGMPFLSENSHGSWKVFDENFPKEKWEIFWEDLAIDQVIGHGAFGVVHRARISKKKLEQKLRLRGESETWLKSSDRNTEKSDPGMEQVAVKMVKICNDLEQLREELATMQNLRFHSQIVGLLGACTKESMFCLVMEYCSGGDLLSYLRKVRAKYYPSHGISEKRVQGCRDTSGWKKICKRTQLSFRRGERNSNASSEFMSENTKGSYMTDYFDMKGSLQSCSSFDSSTSKNEIRTRCDFLTASGQVKIIDSKLSPFNDEISEPSVIHIGDENLRRICELDVLSYARQIAMGMEYLERHHVVHRDLACRNILLLGDYKHVKISDFGLSRDIYTNNMYHQKSDGKLPFRWMAIESIFTHDFTTKSDVWSFGIVLWELITLGGNPYPGLGNNELVQLLESGYRMERPENCSQELYAMMKKCWHDDPASRPSFSDLIMQIELLMEKVVPDLYISFQADSTNSNCIRHDTNHPVEHGHVGASSAREPPLRCTPSALYISKPPITTREERNDLDGNSSQCSYYKTTESLECDRSCQNMNCIFLHEESTSETQCSLNLPISLSFLENGYEEPNHQRNNFLNKLNSPVLCQPDLEKKMYFRFRKYDEIDGLPCKVYEKTRALDLNAPEYGFLISPENMLD